MANKKPVSETMCLAARRTAGACACRAADWQPFLVASTLIEKLIKNASWPTLPTLRNKKHTKTLPNDLGCTSRF